MMPPSIDQPGSAFRGHQATRSAGDPLTRGSRLGCGAQRDAAATVRDGAGGALLAMHRLLRPHDRGHLVRDHPVFGADRHLQNRRAVAQVGPLRRAERDRIQRLRDHGDALAHARHVHQPGRGAQGEEPLPSRARASAPPPGGERARDVDARVFGARLSPRRARASLRRAQEAKPIASDAKRFAEERKRQFSPRSWCRKCEAYKPPRAHHDSVTNRCIVKVRGRAASWTRAHTHPRARAVERMPAARARR